MNQLPSFHVMVDDSKVDPDADQLILDLGGKKYKLSCSATIRSYTSFAA